MLSWRIALHAVRMVVVNWKQALQISAFPLGFATLLLVVVAFNLGLSLEVMFLDTAQVVDENWVGFAISTLGMIFATVWIAVLWHRFVLLEEYPVGIRPNFLSNQIFVYLLTTVLLSAAFFAMAFLSLFSVLALFGSAEVVIISGIFVIVFGWAIIWGRLLIVLPSIAVGNPIGFNGAWAATRGKTLTIVGVFLIVGVAQFLLQLFVGIFSDIHVLSFGLTITVSFMIVPLINISVLTTMYGVFVEGRDID